MAAHEDLQAAQALGSLVAREGLDYRHLYLVSDHYATCIHRGVIHSTLAPLGNWPQSQPTGLQRVLGRSSTHQS